MEGKKVEVPDTEKSTEDFILERSAAIFADLDLETPASLDTVLERSQTIKASEISQVEDLTHYYPGIDKLFANTLGVAINRVAKGDEINGFELQKAYRIAVRAVRTQTTKNFSHIMFLPSAIGNFTDHFSIPVRHDIVENLASESNPLADKYKKRAERWKEKIETGI